MHITNLDMPQYYARVLADIQKYAPEAIIAGGCLRDAYCGRPAKDIDVFVRGDSKIQLDQIMAYKYDKNGESGENDETITCQESWVPFGENCIPVNVIWCAADQSPMDRFKQFDFGACKIAWDGGTSLLLHDEFLWDMKHEIFTVRRCRSPLDALFTLRRWIRIRERYKGWNLHILPEFVPIFQEIKDPEGNQVIAEILQELPHTSGPSFGLLMHT